MSCEFTPFFVNLHAKITKPNNNYLYDTKTNNLLNLLYLKRGKYLQKNPIFPLLIGNELNQISYRARAAFIKSSNVIVKKINLSEAFLTDNTKFWNQYGFKQKPMLWGVNVVIYNKRMQIFCGKRENSSVKGIEPVDLGRIDLIGGKVDLKDFKIGKSLKYALLKGLLREIKEETRINLSTSHLKEAKYKTFINTKRLKPELFMLLPVREKELNYKNTKEIKDLKFRTILQKNYPKYTSNLIFGRKLIKCCSD